MPKRRYSRNAKGQFSSGPAGKVSSGAKSKTKGEALTDARITVATRKAYKRGGSPQFMAKHTKAVKFLAGHGNRAENIEGTKVKRGVTDKHGKKIYVAKRKGFGHGGSGYGKGKS